MWNMFRKSKLIVTQQFAEEFNEKCAKCYAHNFSYFISQTDKNHTSILETIANVGKTLSFQPNKPDKNLEISEEIVSVYMLELFSIYLPNKAHQVEQILNKTHPYFTDSYGNNHINFIYEHSFQHSSHVGHYGNKSFLEFNVFLHNSVNDLRITAHELSHALSSRNQYLIDLIRSNSQEELFKFTQNNFEKDCIAEIESYIVEGLFNRYLLDKGIYTQKDIKNYENIQQNSLLNEINLIQEEQQILKQLPCPVNYPSLDDLVLSLKSNGKNHLIERIKIMHDENKNSAYMFRHVIGRVVAQEWLKNFDFAKDNNTKAEMLTNFQHYLDKTHTLNLDTACEDLLNQNFTSIANNYADKLSQENLQNQQSR